MTSGELLNKRFEKVRKGGYDPAEVEAFLAQAANAFAQLARENGDLKRQVETLRVQTADVEADKDSLRDALFSAQKFADSLVNDAKKKAEDLLADANQKADRATKSVQIQITQQKEELTRIKTEVAAFRSKLLDVYRAHLELIGAMPVEDPDGQQPDLRPAKENRPSTGNEKVPDGSVPSAKQIAAEKPDVDVKAPVKKPDPVGRLEHLAPAGAPQGAAKQVAREAAAAKMPAGVSRPADVQRTPENKPAAAERLAHTVPVRLNMRFDEQTGEYVPLSQGSEEED